MITGKNLIEVRGLKKYFKVSGRLLHAVDDVNLIIHENETLVLWENLGVESPHLAAQSSDLLNPPPAISSIRGKAFCH